MVQPTYHDYLFTTRTQPHHNLLAEDISTSMDLASCASPSSNFSPITAREHDSAQQPWSPLRLQVSPNPSILVHKDSDRGAVDGGAVRDLSDAVNIHCVLDLTASPPDHWNGTLPPIFPWRDDVTMRAESESRSQQCTSQPEIKSTENSTYQDPNSWGITGGYQSRLPRLSPMSVPRSHTVQRTTPIDVPVSTPSNYTVSSTPSSLSSTMSVTSSSCPSILYCTGCSQQFTGEHRRGSRARHMRNKHGKSGVEARRYPCMYCDHRVFHRQDARLRHYRRDHPELELAAPVPRRK